MEEKKSKFKKAIKEESRGYILGGFGLVAGLAWNDAIKALIENFFTFSKDGIWAKFAYALIVTVVVILIGRYILKPKEEVS